MYNRTRLTHSLLAIVTVSLFTSGCANRAATRQEDVDRYEALETELIDQTAAEERRRRSEMRVAQRLRQLDVERAKAEQERKEAEELAQLENLESKKFEDNNLLNLAGSKPVVTQIVVANSSDEQDEALWSLQDFPSPIDGSPLCAVVSQPSQILNGTLDTNVRVIIGTDSIYLRTDATFDLDAPETGFRIDAGFPILFDKFHNELTAVIDKSYFRLRNGLETGSTLIVAFAYSPQLSTAETHVLELSLDSIASPLSQLSNCAGTNEDITEDDQTDQSVPSGPSETADL